MNEFLRTILFLPPQGSEYARSVDHLHFFVIITTMIAAAGVFAVAIYFLVRYRRRSDTDPTPRVLPRPIHEVLFIGVPLSLFLLWFAIGFPQYPHFPPFTFRSSTKKSRRRITSFLQDGQNVLFPGWPGTLPT